MSDLKLRKLPHPSYEAFLGTETIEPCDCKGCEAAYRARLEARKSFAYYEPAQRVSMHARHAHKVWRENQRKKQRARA